MYRSGDVVSAARGELIDWKKRERVRKGKGEVIMRPTDRLERRGLCEDGCGNERHFSKCGILEAAIFYNKGYCFHAFRGAGEKNSWGWNPGQGTLRPSGRMGLIFNGRVINVHLLFSTKETYSFSWFLYCFCSSVIFFLGGCFCFVSCFDGVL